MYALIDYKNKTVKSYTQELDAKIERGYNYESHILIVDEQEFNKLKFQFKEIRLPMNFHLIKDPDDLLILKSGNIDSVKRILRKWGVMSCGGCDVLTDAEISDWINYAKNNDII